MDTPQHWANQFGSGTLRRAIEEDMAWYELYLQERTAFEIGYGFIPVLSSRITIGKPLAESDNPATTETCWWARTLRWRSLRDNREASVKVIHARLDNGSSDIKESIAILYEPKIPLEWLPKNRILIAFTFENNRTVNPC